MEGQTQPRSRTRDDIGTPDDIARRYQRTKLAIGAIEIAISAGGALFLIVSGWTTDLRDLAKTATTPGPASVW